MFPNHREMEMTRWLWVHGFLHYSSLLSVDQPSSRSSKAYEWECKVWVSVSIRPPPPHRSSKWATATTTHHLSVLYGPQPSLLRSLSPLSLPPIPTSRIPDYAASPCAFLSEKDCHTVTHYTFHIWQGSGDNRYCDLLNLSMMFAARARCLWSCWKEIGICTVATVAPVHWSVKIKQWETVCSIIHNTRPQLFHSQTQHYLLGCEQPVCLYTLDIIVKLYDLSVFTFKQQKEIWSFESEDLKVMKCLAALCVVCTNDT